MIESFSKDLFEKNLPTVFNLLKIRGKTIESLIIQKGAFRFITGDSCPDEVIVVFDVGSDIYCRAVKDEKIEIEGLLTETFNEVFSEKIEEYLSIKISPSDPYVDGWRGDKSPSDEFVLNFIGRNDFDLVRIKEFWNKALDRRGEDPSGAVTSASSLLEQVCCEILKRRGEDQDLIGLRKKFNKVATLIGLEAKSYEHESIKKLVGSCVTLVHGFSELRNSGGDAHAGGEKGFSPQERHAEFAVNLAGVLSVFLLKTDRKGE